MSEFAQKIRTFIDELMRTPYLRSLELQVQQQRVDSNERLKDKDALIADLRLRLAVAEADKLRVETKPAVAPRAPITVPDFRGPVGWQDEVSSMTLESEETPNAVS